MHINRLCEGEGEGIGGRARGAEGLEGLPREKVWHDEKAPRRGRGKTEALKKVLKDKEDEISQSKKQLHLAKEDATKEYRDFGALLAKLSCSFVDGFNDYLRQVKASFLNLDLSHITIDAEG